MKKNSTNSNNKSINYNSYLDTALKQERKRMGYPLTGSIVGLFTPLGWKKTSTGTKLVDNRIFGISPDSISDTLIIGIGDPEPSLASEQSRQEKGIYYIEDIENDIIRILAKYFKSDLNEIKGYVTSGGTEANLASVWWLRNYLNNLVKNKFSDQILSSKTSAILYASDQSHYSCKKICQILNIELIEIPSFENGQMNTGCLTNKLQIHMLNEPHRPLIVWANAGTTILGAVDNIQVIDNILSSEVRDKNGVCAVHTDGVILAMTFPLLYPQYASIFKYTDTLSISGHKLLATSSVCGVVLAKKNIVHHAFDNTDISVAYVHGIKDITVTGGRSSLPIFQLHASLKKLGIDNNTTNFRKLIHQCLHNVDILVKGLRLIIGHQHVFNNPRQFNVIFPLLLNAEHAEILKEKYSLMPLENNRVCITIFPNVDKKLIIKFLNDYQDCLKSEQQSSLRCKL